MLKPLQSQTVVPSAFRARREDYETDAAATSRQGYAATRFAWVWVALLLCSPPAHAAKPSKVFPEFQAMKDSLGRVVLIADAVEVADVSRPRTLGRQMTRESGGQEHLVRYKVYLDDCREMVTRALDGMAPVLAKRGYMVQPRPVISIGQLLDSTATCRLFSSRKSKAGDEETLPVDTAPFFVDSALDQGSPVHAAWDSLAMQVWAYRRKKATDPVLTIGAAQMLREPLGADCAFLFLAVGRHISFGKSFAQGLASGLMKVGGSSGKVSFSAGANVQESSGARILFAIVDLRSGTLLWMDEVPEQRAFMPQNQEMPLRDYDMRGVGQEFAERLP